MLSDKIGSGAVPSSALGAKESYRDHHKSPEDLFDGAILELGVESSLYRLFEVVHDTRLDFPELLLDLPKTPLETALKGSSKWISMDLEPSSSCFKRLRGAISSIETALESSELSEDQIAAYREIKQRYESYIEEVCRADMGERIHLIEGPIYLMVHAFGKLQCRELERSTGLRVVSRKRDGNPERQNPDGLNLASRWKCLYFKRAPHGRLHIDKEIIAKHIARHCLEHSKPPHVTFAVCRNVFVRSFFRESLPFNPSCGIKTWLEQNPHLKKSVTYREQRLTDGVQVKKEVTGPTLKKVLEASGQLPGSLDRTQFSLAFLWELLLQDSDGTWDNFVRLLRIDIESPFDGSVIRMAARRFSKGGYFVQQQSILYLFPEMDNLAAPDVLAHFAKLDVEKSLIRLLTDLEHENRKCNEFLRKRALSKEQLDSMGLPVRLPSHALAHLQRVLATVKQIALSDDRVTHRDILGAVDPLLALAYKHIAHEHGSDLRVAQERLKHPLPKSFLEQEEVASLLKGVPLRSNDPSPTCSVQEALVGWVTSRLRSLKEDPERQYKLLLEIRNHFWHLDSFVFDGLSIAPKDLESLIGSWTGLRSLTLQDTRLDFQAIHSLVSQFPKLTLTLGENQQIDSGKLQEVIELARKLDRQLFLLIDGEPVSCLAPTDEIFCQALAAGHTTLAETLYDAGSRVKFELEHRMAREGKKSSITFLLQRGFRLDRPADGSLKSPLHFAAEGNNLKTAGAIHSWLKGTKEYVAFLDPFDKKGRTPLHLAASRGHVEIARKLIELGANRDLRTSDGQTTLHLAAASGQCEFIRWLLEEMPSWVGRYLDSKDKQGMTALHWASSCSSEATQILIEAGCDVNAQTRADQSALHLAAKAGNAESVAALLQAGAERICRDDNNMSPLSYAIDRACDDEKYREIGLLLLASTAPFEAAPAAAQPSRSSPSLTLSGTPPRSHSSASLTAQLRRTASSRGIGRTLRSFSIRGRSQQVSPRSEFSLPKEGESPAQSAWIAIEKAQASMKGGQWVDAAKYLEYASQWVDRSHVPMIDLERERLERCCCDALKVRWTGDLIGRYGRDRAGWEKMRTHFAGQLNSRYPFVSLYEKELSKEVRGFLEGVVKEYIDGMEPAPNPFAVIAGGHLAREEMLPYSPLSLLFLVTESKPYYERLAQAVMVRSVAWGVPLDVQIVRAQHDEGRRMAASGVWLYGKKASFEKALRFRRLRGPDRTEVECFKGALAPPRISTPIDLSQLDRMVCTGVDALVCYYGTAARRQGRSIAPGTSNRLAWLVNSKFMDADTRKQLEEAFDVISLWRARAQEFSGASHEVVTTDETQTDLLQIDSKKLTQINTSLLSFYFSVCELASSKIPSKKFILSTKTQRSDISVSERLLSRTTSERML